MTTTRVLILGGTSEGRRLAALLDQHPGVQVTSSLAGRVADPALPAGGVRIGGFGGADGLAQYVRDEDVTVLVDATHPFATTITSSAKTAAERTGVPLLGIRRPGWTEEPGDVWHRVTAITDAAQLLDRMRLPADGNSAALRVMLTTGRRDLAPFVDCDRHWFLIRTVDPPTGALPMQCEVLLARGPYTVEGETALLRDHRIDVLITKDSGGELTRAKLVAARKLGVAVVMVDRPPYPLVSVVETPEAAADWVLRLAG